MLIFYILQTVLQLHYLLHELILSELKLLLVNVVTIEGLKFLLCLNGRQHIALVALNLGYWAGVKVLASKAKVSKIGEFINLTKRIQAANRILREKEDP